MTIYGSVITDTAFEIYLIHHLVYTISVYNILKKNCLLTMWEKLHEKSGNVTFVIMNGFLEMGKNPYVVQAVRLLTGIRRND